MPSSNANLSETEGVEVLFFSIPSGLLLQLGAGAMLGLLLGSKAIAETLQTIGQASEEIFRGDRLPLLEFPEETESASN